MRIKCFVELVSDEVATQSFYKSRADYFLKKFNAETDPVYQAFYQDMCELYVSYVAKCEAVFSEYGKMTLHNSEGIPLTLTF